MKISIAQTHSFKGEVHKNIENHLDFIELAVKKDSDTVFFPELSITSYEPTLAKKLATQVDDAIFNPFQKVADEKNIVIGIGMPTKAINGINISMFIFQAFRERLVYSKRILHADELPYFTRGAHQPFLTIKGTKIGIGICYETLQREHFIRAANNGADIYIASVAKADKGVDKAYIHFPSIAKEFKIPILMSNCIGYCDNFLSNGQSSVWNQNGQLLKQLDTETQGILIYDTELNEAESYSFS